MTIKSQIDYHCPACGLAWLPYADALCCPRCGRPVPIGEVTAIVQETLESAKFNKRLYGKYELEYWLDRRIGDLYMKWAFKALDLAEQNPNEPPEQLALAALMSIDLEALAPYREHVHGFLAAAVSAWRAAHRQNPSDWQKIPEPEKPFFGRKIIDD
jgi:hypothetical protein